MGPNRNLGYLPGDRPHSFSFEFSMNTSLVDPAIHGRVLPHAWCLLFSETVISRKFMHLSCASTLLPRSALGRYDWYWTFSWYLSPAVEEQVHT